MGWFADFRFANHNVVVDSRTPRKHGLFFPENFMFAFFDYDSWGVKKCSKLYC